MDRHEAFEFLNLDPSASNESIEKRFRELVLDYHPDAKGNKEKMTKLQEARDTALNKETNLLSVDENSLKEFTNSVRRQEYHQDSEKTVDRLVRRHTSRFRRKKQMTAIFGGLFGLVFVIVRFWDSSALSSLFKESIFSIFLTTYAMAFGMMFWMCHMQMKNIETLINEADEALEDKMQFVNLLQDIGIDYRNSPSFTRYEVERRVADWIEGNSLSHSSRPHVFTFLPPELDFQELAEQVGASDFSRLLIRKGLATDLITENDRIEEGDLVFLYQINLPKN